MEFKAVVVDVDGTITFADRRLDCRAVEALRSLHVPVVIATGNVLCVARTAAKLLGTDGIVIAEIGLRRDFDVEMARELLKEFPGVEIVDTGFAVHIKSKRINKGTGLKRIAKMMGLDAREFVAIGDSPNDIEMLKVSGFGVAVGNAHPEVKRVARMVTKGEYGAGVAEAVGELKEKGAIR